MDPDTPPTPEGHGRLVIDVVDGPTAVQQVRMASEERLNGQGRPRYAFYETFEELCPTTPCVADLPLGNVLLGFPVLGDSGETEVELVYVGEDPSVYRRALGLYERNSHGAYVLGIVGTSFGGSAVVTGTALLPVGLAKDKDGLALAGAITLGTGALLTALSIWAMVANAPSYQEGAAIHFDLPH
jgi:hypothetical protein